MYKIMGGDQREYGPATSDQIREWIGNGRANGQTMASFEGSAWKPLSTFPEFADVLRSASPPPLPQAVYSGQGSMGAKSNTLSIVGLILCVIVCCPPLPLVGLVLCAIGLSQIQRNPQEYTTGKIVPIIGIVIGILSIIMNIVTIRSDAFSDMMRNFPQ